MHMTDFLSRTWLNGRLCVENVFVVHKPGANLIKLKEIFFQLDMGRGTNSYSKTEVWLYHCNVSPAEGSEMSSVVESVS